VLGNILGLLDPPRRPPRAWSIAGSLLCVTSLAVASYPAAEEWPLCGLGAEAISERLASLGLTRRNLPSSLLAGGLLGLVLGLPGLALLILPEELLPVVAEEERFGLAGAVLFSFGHLLVATAAGEELAFRGVLQYKLRSAVGPRKAMMLGSMFFALWHGVFNARTLSALGVRGWRRLGLGSALQLLSVYVGGLAFGALRERSGNLAGSILAHWLTDVLLNARLFLRLRRG
jgi:membrane protease YdiL (CAAX protease family)